MSKYNSISNCYINLYMYSKKKGYLTFNDINNEMSWHNLSFSEMEFVVNRLRTIGIDIFKDNEEIKENTDYSHTDYEKIYDDLLNMSSDVKYVVELIKEFPFPQKKEVDKLLSYRWDKESRERIVFLFARNVLKTALRCSKVYSIEIEDAISAGFDGLLTAIDKFEDNKSGSFHSYAELSIFNCIQRTCFPFWLQHKISATDYKNIQKILKCRSEYSTLLEENEEAIYYLLWELNHEKIDKTIQLINNEKYGKIDIDKIIEPDELKIFSNIYNFSLSYDDVEELSLLDEYIMDDLQKEPFEIYCEKDLKRNVDGILDKLTEREETVLRYRFGMIDGIPKELEEIAEYFNVTRERIRQIEAKALRKLKKTSVENRLKDFLY